MYIIGLSVESVLLYCKQMFHQRPLAGPSRGLIASPHLPPWGVACGVPYPPLYGSDKQKGNPMNFLQQQFHPDSAFSRWVEGIKIDVDKPYSEIERMAELIKQRDFPDTNSEKTKRVN